MSQISVKWHLIPDGLSSIVLVTIEGEFTVNSANATAEAEAGIAALVARIGTEDAETIQQKLTADVWLGDHERPDEPGPREREESIPSTSRRAHLRDGSSLSRRDPMPVLFVVGLAILTFAAITVFGEFLFAIWGGK